MTSRPQHFSGRSSGCPLGHLSGCRITDRPAATDILAAVEQLLESTLPATGSPWLTRQALGEQLRQNHGLDIDCPSVAQGFRRLLAHSGRFVLYGTPQPGEYHVALRRVLFPQDCLRQQPRPRPRDVS